MTTGKTELLLIGPPKRVFVEGLAVSFDVTRLADVTDREKFFAETAPRLRGIACSWTNERVEGEFMRRLPRLEIVSTFGGSTAHTSAARALERVPRSCPARTGSAQFRKTSGWKA